MKNQMLLLIPMMLIYSCTNKNKPASQLITLSNGTIEIGILPSVGGSLVRASLVGHQNILNSDSAQWNESPDKRPSLDPKAPFKAYNGHITWLNPQSEWWTKQNVFPDLKVARSPWPPDPILTLAPYRVINQKSTEITLISPESPYSKVQFTKIFRIEKNKVFITTVARNISKDTVSWGLWHNTRMNGWDVVFIQANPTELLRTEYNAFKNIHLPELQYFGGFYSYLATKPALAKQGYKSKSFFSVGEPLIAGHHKNQWLIIQSNAIDPELIHPKQARIELYVENSGTPEKDLQELEMQFAYETIAPGATIEASETWEILPGSSLTDKSALLEELKGKLN